MRLLRKLLMKLVTMVIMVLVMGSAMRYGQRYILKAAGVPAMPSVEGVDGVPKFSSEEADLMSTVFKSAIRLFTGSAKRNELASELSDKLYAGRADAGTMSELGIELVKPGGATPPGVETRAGTSQPGASTGTLPPGATAANAQPGAVSAATQRAARLAVKVGAPVSKQPAANPASDRRDALLARVWAQAKANSLEFSLIPVVLLGMFLVQRVRRRSGGDDFLPAALGLQTPAETETYHMAHAVYSLPVEDFELLVALIYQRQGYRVSMPAGLSGGRGGDFTLARKAERILVQCKKLSPEHRLPVERVRELREAMTIADLTRGMYVASCGFTWDARNFAKANGITLINGRTLDALLDAARENPEEDLLEVSQWVPKLISKVQITPALCPACEAAMDQLSVSHGSVWVCSQRPDCRGRRIARKHQKPDLAAARRAEQQTDGAGKTDAASPVDGAKQRSVIKQVEDAKPRSGINQVAGAGKSSGIRPVENITHPDPVRQEELTRLAELARQALQAKRAARVKQEEEAAQAKQAKQAAPAAPANPTRPVTPATPATPTRQATPAPPANQVRQATPAAPANQVRQVTPATPGNRATPVNQARQAVPATPGNRPTPTNQARRAVPATPGNRP